MQRINIFGAVYDDAEPCFFPVGDNFYYSRITRRLIGKASLDAMAVLMDYTFEDYEMGEPSEAYLNENTIPALPAEPLFPITATVTKVPAGVDDTGEITVEGGPANKQYTLTLTVKDALSENASESQTIIPKYTGKNNVAQTAADNMGDPNVSAESDANVITFAPFSGSEIETLTVSIA